MKMELEKPYIQITESASGRGAKVIVEPLERGYGNTLGNTLRRVLLSNLPGAAVIAVKIAGVAHEFTTVKGVVEDVTDIILNLKGLVIKTISEDIDTKSVMRLKTSKAGEVFAKDLEYSSDITICNPDAVICTLDGGTEVNMEIIVGRGRGYVVAKDHKGATENIGTIAIDSLFSPVEKVNYFVEAARVGQKIDYDKLIMEVTTNGSATAKEVISLAARLVQDHLQIFVDMTSGMSQVQTLIDRKEDNRIILMQMSIEDLELSQRSSNCLKRAGITTIDSLLKKTKFELARVRNMGQKSLEEIILKLESLNLSLREEEE